MAVTDFFGSSMNLQRILMPINQRLMAKLKVSGHSSVVWYWSGDPMVPRSNPLLVRKFLLLSLLIWKGGFEILQNDTWDLLKKAYGTSKKLRFQFRGQLNKPFSEPTYLYTNLTPTVWIPNGGFVYILWFRVIAMNFNWFKVFWTLKHVGSSESWSLYSAIDTIYM